METLLPEFMKAAFGLDLSQSSDNATESKAGETKALTLEFNANPFKDFIKKIEYLIEVDPSEAARVLRSAIAEGFFSEKLQVSLLDTKLAEVTQQLKYEMQSPAPSGYAPQFQRACQMPGCRM